MLDNLKNSLQEIGLPKNESEIYLSLLPLGRTTASILSYRTAMTRHAARYHCRQLVKKRLISEEKEGNTFFYTAEPPEKIFFLLDEEKKKIAAKEEQANRIISDLNSIVNPNTALPKIRLLAGKEGEVSELDKKGFLKFCEASLKCKSKEILFASSIENFRNIVTEKYDMGYYVPTRIKRGVFLKLLCVRSDLTEKMKKQDKVDNRETRFLPKEFRIKNTIFIFDNVTTLISNEEHPNCIMIDSKEISDTWKKLFHFMWANAET